MRVLLGAVLALAMATSAASMTVCAADPGACGIRMCRFSAGHHRYDFRPCPTNPPRGMISVLAAMTAAEQARFCRQYPGDCLPAPQSDGGMAATPRWIARPYQGSAPGGFVPP
ncbi:MAG TPA: hypothetical protein VHW60_00735 [Caulobacteraceae bacterium]|jgi:hypothetical protein|nr:hypothetical protein [Caulobacteraceae bacterium]